MECFWLDLTESQGVFNIRVGVWFGKQICAAGKNGLESAHLESVSTKVILEQVSSLMSILF